MPFGFCEGGASVVALLSLVAVDSVGKTLGWDSCCSMLFLMWHCTFYFCNFSCKFLQILLCKLRVALGRNKRSEMFLN